MISLLHRRIALRPALVVLALAPALSLGCRNEITPPPLPTTGLSLEEPAPSAGHSARRLANIGSSSVEVPATGAAGQPVPITVTTYGGGCIGEDTTVVDVHGLHADIVPYQRVYNPGANGACTMELRINPRQLQVVFAQPGIASVVVYSRAADGSLVSISRALAVK